MARPKSQAPALRYHISGKAVCTIDGRDFYLGAHNSPESFARYAVLMQEYQSGGLSLPEGFSMGSIEERIEAVLRKETKVASLQETGPKLVSHITAAYVEHITERYKNTPQEFRRHKRLCEQLDDQYGNNPAESFGPLKLRKFRKWLVDQGLARKYVNRLTNCVVAIFAHAVSEEMVKAEQVFALKTIESLHYGQTDAPETEAVVPVDIETVRKTAKHLPPPVRAMLRIQLVTGMRPKEICMMRPSDIDRTGDIWIYTPSTHKTKWRGKTKQIPIIGDAKQAVLDYLNRDPETFLFSPIESMAWRRAVGTVKRTTPLSCGNRIGTNRKENPERTPRDHYDATSYRQCIKRAAKKAGVVEWHPYQCRHLTATAIRSALGGLEEARSLLGHSTALQTAHYAMENLRKAATASEAAPRL